ncbi:MAG: BatA domain-containing protein, partial [Elusimicrobiota bacterium]
MNFSFPAALWALPAAALPVLFHLLARRAARKVLFSDLTLLRAIDARARPKARLRELVLLAARCVLIAALVMAAAGPSQRGQASGKEEGLDLTLLLDVSYSTRARDGVQVRFDAARQAGQRLLKRLAAGDRVAVGLFEDGRRMDLTWGDARTADAALAAARPGWRSSDAAAAITAAREFMSGSPATRRRAVVVLGDGAAHSLRSDLPAPGAGDTLLGLRFPELSNAWLEAASPSANSRARAPRLEVRSGASGAPVETPLDLWIGEKRAASTSLSVKSAGEGRATLALPAPEDPTSPSWSGRLAQRADSLAVDDEIFFSFSHRPEPRVLVLYWDSSFFRAGKSGWFLRELFGGSRETLVGREADFLEAARWYEADLARYGTVLLADASKPGPGLAAALESFLQRGGGVWLVPGVRSSPGDLAPYSWLPARIGASDMPESPRGVRAALEGGATAGWSELDLSRVTILRRFQLDPLPGAEVWAVDAGGSPLLVAGSAGRGRVVVWGAPLDAGWSNLGLKPLFVPWAQGCLGLSVPQTSADAIRRVFVGEPIVRTWATADAAPDKVKVRSPDGRWTTLEVVGRRAALPEAKVPGLYVFEAVGGKASIYAVNLDASRGESDLTQANSPPWRRVDAQTLESEFFEEVYGRSMTGL